MIALYTLFCYINYSFLKKKSYTKVCSIHFLASLSSPWISSHFMCSAEKLGYYQFLPLIPYYIPVFHITYSCVMITQYIVTIITLDKQVPITSVNFKKNKYFFFPSIILSSVIFLSSCRFEFLSKSFSFPIRKIKKKIAEAFCQQWILPFSFVWKSLSSFTFEG